MACAVIVSVCNTAAAVEIQPGVGVAVEYTDNAKLKPDNVVDDVITVGYVGVKLSENDGTLLYNAATSINNQKYTKNTSEGRRNFNLAADANWEMIKEQFDWFLSDKFSQRTILSVNSNTVDNLQDSNVFTLGARIRHPISTRQSFSLTPLFNQYYYESTPTNNKQYSIAANWNYYIFRLTSMGLNLSARKVDYTERNAFGVGITDTTFTNFAISFNGQRLRSDFSINLGATNVKRGSNTGNTGFTGSLSWLANLTSHSKLKTLVLTEITDTSRLSANTAGNPANGNPDDVQISTDVIRNSIINLGYLREDEKLHSRIWTEYRELKYSSLPLDTIVNEYGVELNYPVTQLLSSGAYVIHNRTKRLDTARLDRRYIIGGDLKYDFSRKLHGLLDFKYRKKESTSTAAAQNFDEYSVFVSLVYGFGNVQRPTRVGGF